MNASGQSKNTPDMIFTGVQKSQKRFRVGQRVVAKFWEGYTVERFGTVQQVGKTDLIVSWDTVGARLTPRLAILKIVEGGK